MMFKLLDRYIAGQVIKVTAVIWVSLVLLFSALQWISELRDMAGDYHILDTLWHNVLTIPQRAYRLFPFVALAGSLWAVSRLAASEQLVVMRANGCARSKIIRPVLAALSTLLVIALLAGEFSGAFLEPKARNFRIGKITGTLSLANPEGLWLRDGESVVHILRPLMLPDGGTDFRRLRFFDANNGRLCEWLEAQRGEHHSQQWRLEEVTEVNLCESPVRRQQQSAVTWPSELPPDLLANVALRPSVLPVWELWAYVEFLEANGLDPYRYKIAFYQRLYVAPTILLLVWLTIPFVLGSTRQISRGKRIAMGLGLGLGAYISHQLIESITGVYQLNPAVSTALPILLNLLIGMVVYQRTRMST